jgi:hypothetical protein
MKTIQNEDAKKREIAHNTCNKCNVYNCLGFIEDTYHVHNLNFTKNYIQTIYLCRECGSCVRMGGCRSSHQI